jgi:asparagine synthase (glutamine-hydrolysing)
MCGICGFTGKSDHVLLRAMTDSLTHRGPDDWGYFEDDEMSLGVRRLKIIDPTTGHQPIGNEDGSIWVIFNGEIYNYRSLEQELSSNGHSFATRSDTETIIHAYEEFDLGFLDRLSGMFALALWDQRKHRLVLARDRIGMKPLYYVESPSGLAFASEIKGLLVRWDVRRIPSRAVLRLILAFGYSPDARTPFEGILKLPPGHILLRENGRSTVRRYWDLPLEGRFDGDQGTVVATLRRLLKNSVSTHLVADVPIGIMLSGGIDSAAIATLAKDVVGDRLQTFTFAYADESDSTDRNSAAEVASFLSTEHREIILDPEDLLQLLTSVIYHHDEPKVDAASFPTLATAVSIKKHATVVLVGEGSDEQFGGYDSHMHFARTRAYRRFVPGLFHSDRFLNFVDAQPRLRSRLRAVEYLGSLEDPNLALRIINSPVFTDWDFNRSRAGSFETSTRDADPADVYKPLLLQAGGRDLLVPTVVDLKVYIPNDISMKIDKMTMAASVEARMPFLDTNLLEFTPRIDPFVKTKGGTTKPLLRKALAGKLPRHILKRPKEAIRVPVGRWIGAHIDTFAEIAEQSMSSKRSPVSKEALNRIVRRAARGTDLHAAHQLLALSVLETWYRLYVDPEEWRAGVPGPNWS